MKVHFFQPPPAQSIGGLDAAIRGLRGALVEEGICVDEEFPSDAEGVVHFHGLWQPRHSKLARQCRERGIPYVVSPHGMLEPWAWRHKRWKKLPYYHLVEKCFLRGAAGLLATAASEGERLREFLPAQRIEVLPLGLTGEAAPAYEKARETLGWPAQERVLLYLSRIHPKKGLDILLQALVGLTAGTPVRLVIVGGGDEGWLRSLQTFAEENRTRLPPIDWRGEIWGEARWPYFQGSDLFCLPTHSENFGLAVLEALQVGTPVLTTRATPWGTALEEGRGYVGEPRAESIRGLLRRFLDEPRRDSQSRTALAAWAAENFSWPSLGPRYRAFYEEIAAAAGARAR